MTSINSDHGNDGTNETVGSVGLARQVIHDAIQQVPAVRYALGVTGLSAAAFLGSVGFGLDLGRAFISVVGMLLLMVVLMVLARARAPELAAAAVVLIRAYTLIMIVIPALLISSAFFGQPLDLRSWVVGVETRTVHESAALDALTPSSSAVRSRGANLPAVTGIATIEAPLRDAEPAAPGVSGREANTLIPSSAKPKRSSGPSGSEAATVPPCKLLERTGNTFTFACSCNGKRFQTRAEEIDERRALASRASDIFARCNQ